MNKQQKQHVLVLAAVVIVVFLGSLFLAINNGLYISPDETANAHFARTFAETGELSYFDPNNFELSNLLIPRSMVSVDGFLAPGSFLGLPVLFGSLAFIFSVGVLPFFTPIIAAIAVFLWYGVLRRLTSQKLALFGAILLAMHPGWWYYTARSLMHNVLFTSFLIASAYVFLAQPLKKRLLPFNNLIAGGFFGLAIFVRTSEIIWLGFTALLIAILARMHLTWKQIALFGLGALIAILPLPFFNTMTYGSPYITGYTIENGVETTIVSDVVEIAAPEPITPAAWEAFQERIKPIFPFGIRPRNILRHTTWYGINLFWWMSVLALIGVALFVKERGKEEYKRKIYFWTFVFVSAWLAIMYGSWVIQDNPDPNAVTIGNSYIRYWLPVFVLMTPFAAKGIEWLANRTRTDLAKLLVVLTLFTASFGLSVHAVYTASDDGLLSVRQTLDRSKGIKARILELTEEDAVIIVDRADKLVFPDRSVRQPLRDERTYEIMPFIVKESPLYYYGVTFPARDMRFLNDVKLAETNLKIELIETFDAESLYRIIPR